MYDEFRKPLQSVGPGQPVEIWGFKETPSAGEEILQVKSEVCLISLQGDCRQFPLPGTGAPPGELRQNQESPRNLGNIPGTILCTQN